MVFGHAGWSGDMSVALQLQSLHSLLLPLSTQLQPFEDYGSCFFFSFSFFWGVGGGGCGEAHLVKTKSEKSQIFMVPNGMLYPTAAMLVTWSMHEIHRNFGCISLENGLVIKKIKVYWQVIYKHHYTQNKITSFIMANSSRPGYHVNLSITINDRFFKDFFNTINDLFFLCV